MTGRELSEMLARLGLSQSAAAERMGVTTRSLRRWCADDEVPVLVELAVKLFDMERAMSKLNYAKKRYRRDQLLTPEEDEREALRTLGIVAVPAAPKRRPSKASQSQQALDHTNEFERQGGVIKRLPPKERR